MNFPVARTPVCVCGFSRGPPHSLFPYTECVCASIRSVLGIDVFLQFLAFILLFWCSSINCDESVRVSYIFKAKWRLFNSIVVKVKCGLGSERESACFWLASKRQSSSSSATTTPCFSSSCFPSLHIFFHNSWFIYETLFAVFAKLFLSSVRYIDVAPCDLLGRVTPVFRSPTNFGRNSQNVSKEKKNAIGI